MKQQPPGGYRGYRNAGIRMSEELDASFTQGREQSEARDLTAFHMYDKAHCVMLTETGIIPAESGSAMLRALRALEKHPDGIVQARTDIGGGMHSGEMYLIRELGEELGGWSHVGRSSVDLRVVARRIGERNGLLDLLEALDDFCHILIDLAEQHVDTVIPGFFGSQIVQPTTLGHQLLAAAYGFSRDAQRVEEAYARTNLNAGGGVVLTGTSFPIDRQRVADLLGFNGVVANTADAVAGNDTTVECSSVTVMVAQQVDVLNHFVDRLMASENRYVTLPDRYLAASSLAMQMKTPLPIGRGLLPSTMANIVAATADTGTFASASADDALQSTARTLKALGKVVGAIRVDRQRALAAVLNSDAGATDLGAMLVTLGIPWRSAHQICGIVFRLCEERGLSSSDIDEALLDEAAIDYFGKPLGATTENIQQAMDPQRIVASRRLVGGSAPEQMASQIEHLRKDLNAHQDWLAVARRRIAEAAIALERAIDALTVSA